MVLTVPAVVHAARRGGAELEGDAPARLLALAVAGLPESHRHWGQAMGAELATVRGTAPRWRFGLGCARAAVQIRTRVTLTSPEPGGAGLRATIGAGVVTAAALAGYGAIRYPGLRVDRGAGFGAIAFVALLLVFAAAAWVLSRGTGPGAAASRRVGTCGGVAIGAAWLLIISPPGPVKEWVLVPVVFVLLAPACVAAAAGSRAALWSGILAGLIVFAVWTTTAYARDGRPYDAQLLRDFHRSGARDLATYAVGDVLSGALLLLILIPLTALAFGSLGARFRRS